MAGFGFSIGDFFAVGQFAWTVYKSCKGAGGAFEEVSHEVIALHTTLKELEDEFENPDSLLNRADASKRKDLTLLVRNCRSVLKSLNQLLIKYKSLGTSSKKTWDRVRFGAENLGEIREKLMSHTASLTLFLTTLGTGSLGRIEKKLDELIEDVRAGRKEKSVLTMVDEDEEDSESMWNEWKGELVEEGFTKVELEGHKHWIIAKLRELIDNGGLDKVPVTSRRVQIPQSSKSPQVSNGPAPPAPYIEDADDEDFMPSGWKGKGVDRYSEQDSTIKMSDPNPDFELRKEYSPQSDEENDSDETFLEPADSMSTGIFGSLDTPPEPSPASRGPPDSTPALASSSSRAGMREDLEGVWTTKLKELLEIVPRQELISVLAVEGNPLLNEEKKTPKDFDKKMMEPEAAHYPAHTISKNTRDRKYPDKQRPDRQAYILSISGTAQPFSDRGRCPRPGITAHAPQIGAKSERSSHLRSEDMLPKWDVYKEFAGKYMSGARVQMAKDKIRSSQRGDIDHEPKYRNFSTNQHRLYYDISISSSNSKIIEWNVPLSLGDMFNGTRKQISLGHVRLIDPKTKARVTQTVDLEIDVRPGLREGSVIKYAGVGHELEDSTHQEVHFIVTPESHPNFHIIGDDLHSDVKISLVESLCGFSRRLFTIDGKSLEFSKFLLTEPGSLKTFAGLGMPKTEHPDQRGDFVVTFKVTYPKALTQEQESSIRKAFKAKHETDKHVKSWDRRKTGK